MRSALPYHLRCRLISPCAPPDVAVTWSWKNPSRLQSIALWDLGPHARSLLVPLLDEVTAVVAGAGRGDQIHLILQHPGNCSSTASVSLTAPTGTGTQLYADGEHGRQTLPEPSLENTRVVAAHQAALDALIDLAVHPLRGHPCDVHFGARVVEVLDAAQRSLASGCRVEVSVVRVGS